MENAICYLSKNNYPLDQLIAYDAIKYQLIKFIQDEYPGFSKGDYILNDSLKIIRKKYLEKLLKLENKELNDIDNQVISAIENNSLISNNLEPALEAKQTFGQKTADKIASFGGSWKFILIFFTFLFGWIALNAIILNLKAFDPYPFILMNLILSTIAALQAPVIMMSQNRQEEKDRQHAENDYLVNLKAELEVRNLHRKMNLLMEEQIKTLMDVQAIQLKNLEDLAIEIQQIKQQ